MSVIRLDFTCPICEIKTSFIATKPNRLASSIEKVRCKPDNGGCNSMFQVAVNKTDTKSKSKIDVINLELSAKAIQIQRDKRKELNGIVAN